MSLKRKLIKLGACESAVKWAEGFNRAEKKAYDECKRPDWLLWMAIRSKVSAKLIVKCLIELGDICKYTRFKRARELLNGFCNSSMLVGPAYIRDWERLFWMEKGQYWQGVHRLVGSDGNIAWWQPDMVFKLFYYDKQNRLFESSILSRRSKRILQATKKHITWPMLRDAINLASRGTK
jgi:hypothetical protein